MLLQRLTNRLIRVTGYPQEYLCLEANSLKDRFRWTLDGVPFPPERLLFLGYRPLVLGLPTEVAMAEGRLNLEHKGKAIAGMRLEELRADRWPGVRLFTGTAPWQRFLPKFLEPIDRLRQRWNAQRTGNVAGPMTEYDLLRIAYTQPREVHLAVVGPPERCNIFPTDLHGAVNDDGYIISLRHANAACAQVQERGELLLCRMALDTYKDIYRLGARHNAAWESAERIRATATHFKDHAVPTGALSVQFMELNDHFDIGIHRLHRFAVKERADLDNGPVLAHAHAAPLGWLKRKGIAPPVLLR